MLIFDPVAWDILVLVPTEHAPKLILLPRVQVDAEQQAHDIVVCSRDCTGVQSPMPLQQGLGMVTPSGGKKKYNKNIKKCKRQRDMTIKLEKLKTRSEFSFDENVSWQISNLFCVGHL